MKVLIIDDDSKIVTILKAYLEKAEYEVLTAEDGLQGLTKALMEQPDIILLDVMMPEMDGWEVCQEVRKVSSVPIIMLTAREEEVDRIKGLDIGADDYVVKPFSPKEVIARIRAITRRISMDEKNGGTRLLSSGYAKAETPLTEENNASETEVLTVGGLTLNKLSRDVIAEGVPVVLTPTEFKMCELLMSHPGRVFSRTHLLQAVQDMAFEGYDRTIDSHIKNLRKKLNAAPEAAYMIKTVYGIGYKMIGEGHA